MGGFIPEQAKETERAHLHRWSMGLRFRRFRRTVCENRANCKNLHMNKGPEVQVKMKTALKLPDFSNKYGIKREIAKRSIYPRFILDVNA